MLSIFPQPSLSEALSRTLSELSSFSFLFSPHPSHSGTTSLPWLGGCNLLQAAVQAERSPSYLDRGSPAKSYQREGVFKYSCNCGNHFLLSPNLMVWGLHLPFPSLGFFPPPTTGPLTRPPTTNSLTFFSPAFQYDLPSFPGVSSSSIQLILAHGVGSGADSCMTRNVSLCKSLLPPRAVLA